MLTTLVPDPFLFFYQAVPTIPWHRLQICSCFYLSVPFILSTLLHLTYQCFCCYQINALTDLQMCGHSPRASSLNLPNSSIRKQFLQVIPVFYHLIALLYHLLCFFTTKESTYAVRPIWSRIKLNVCFGGHGNQLFGREPFCFIYNFIPF